MYAENKNYNMKKLVSLVLFMLIGLALMVTNAQALTVTVNSTYRDFIFNPVDLKTYIWFSTNFMNETKYFLIGNNATNLKVLRFDMYGNLEEERIKSSVNLTLGNSVNLWFWSTDEILIPTVDYTGYGYMLRFNLTLYYLGYDGLQIISSSYNTGVNSFQDTISISTILTKSSYNTIYNIQNDYTIGIAYKKSSDLWITYDFYDFINHTFDLINKKHIYWNTGLSDVRKFYLFTTENNCFYFDSCIFHILFEGRSSTNSNRLGIYVREVHRGMFGWEFYDKGLIGFDSSIGFQSQIVGIDYWFSTHQYPFLAKKIYFRAIQGNNRIMAVDSFDTLWNFISEQSINGYGTSNITAFQQKAVKLPTNNINVNLNNTFYIVGHAEKICSSPDYTYYYTYGYDLNVTDSHNASRKETITKYNLLGTCAFGVIFNITSLGKHSVSFNASSYNVSIYVGICRNFLTIPKQTCIDGTGYLEIFPNSQLSQFSYKPMFTVTEDYYGEIEAYSLFSNADYYYDTNNFGMQTVNQACRCNDWIYTGCLNTTHTRRTRACSPTACASEIELYLNDSCLPTGGGGVGGLTQGVNPNYTSTSLVNFTSLTGGDNPMFSIIAVLFTPFFLASMLMIGISAYVSNYIGGDNKGMVFGICCLVIMMIYSIIGIYPLWLVIIMILIAGVILAKQFGVIGK